jgi:hypothetical protein
LPLKRFTQLNFEDAPIELFIRLLDFIETVKDATESTFDPTSGFICYLNNDGSVSLRRPAWYFDLRDALMKFATATVDLDAIKFVEDLEPPQSDEKIAEDTISDVYLIRTPRRSFLSEGFDMELVPCYVDNQALGIPFSQSAGFALGSFLLAASRGNLEVTIKSSIVSNIRSADVYLWFRHDFCRLVTVPTDTQPEPLELFQSMLKQVISVTFASLFDSK